MQTAKINHFKLFPAIADAGLLFLYCGLIYYLSAQSKLLVPLWFPHQDKLIHAIAYALMAALSWRCFHHLPLSLFKLAMISVLFSSFFGVTDEWHQSFVPGRLADPLDWLADSLGAIICVWVLYHQQKRHHVAKMTTPIKPDATHYD